MTDFSRYQRQLLLPQMDDQKQIKISKSKVLVVGVGGLGCPVLTTLTASGVGHLGLVDFDKVSLTNLHRQHLFSEEDIGKLKTEVAKSRLEKLNSQTRFSLYSEPISKENIFQLIADYDVVVDCTDNFPTRYLLNDVCYLLKKPLIYAAIYQNEGQLSVFNVISNEYEATNLRDIFAEMPNQQDFPNCNEAGVMGVLTAIIGNFQANEVIKLLIESKELFLNKLLLFNSLNYQTQIIKFKKNNQIYIPNTKEAILSFDYGETCFLDFNFIDHKYELEKWITEKNAILVDVRNADEMPRINHIYPNVVEIPISQLGVEANKLNKNSLVFVCQSGMRSKKALEWAKEKFPNKEITHIEGGVKSIL
jgi:sulfur-carrier protein adenylyltransferase/sulfurtransferase